MDSELTEVTATPAVMRLPFSVCVCVSCQGVFAVSLFPTESDLNIHRLFD